MLTGRTGLTTQLQQQRCISRKLLTHNNVTLTFSKVSTPLRVSVVCSTPLVVGTLPALSTSMSLCIKCNVMYGTPDTGGLCSMCFRQAGDAGNIAEWEKKKKERADFEKTWNETTDADRLLALYLMPPASFSPDTLPSLVVGKFTDHFRKHEADMLAILLHIEEFRPIIFNAANEIWTRYFGVNRAVKYAGESDAATENRINTFSVLLQEVPFRKQFTAKHLQSALDIHLDEVILRKMLDMSLDSISISQILEDYKTRMTRFNYRSPVPPACLTNIQLLEEYVDLTIAKLNDEGRYVNRNVILCSDSKASFPTPFLHGEYEDGEAPLSKLEMLFLQLSQLIRLKENWREKCQDPDIVEKWEAEVKEQNGDPRLLRLAVQQARLLADIGRDEMFEASPVDGVYMSDKIIPHEVLVGLREAATKLQNSEPVDYHPGSNEQVVDIVHPSLYPAVVGRTRVLDKPALTLASSWKKFLGGLGVPTLTVFPREGRTRPVAFSQKFQWLPAEFNVEDDGSVHINSYINNLHPKKYHFMYPLLEKLFGSCIPMVEQVLSDCVNEHKLRLIDDPGKYEMYDEEPSDLDDEEWDEYYENRIPKDIPLPEKFPGENISHLVNRKVSLRGKHLQVIVKLASIELTPEKPKYEGGVWHVEGMQNEDIVCTLIHYYSCENISESRLQFRQAIREPYYEQNDEVGVAHRYELHDNDPLNQELGYVVAKEGRTIAFPNLYQHCVQPFELLDPTKAGHRKILVFFVVNPLNRVLSTADVPPQQVSWAVQDSVSCLHSVLSDVANIPYDVTSCIYEYLDFPLGRAEAESLRSALMEERSYYVDELTQNVFERPFSLCEH